jgi:hypothetical protein
MKSLLAALVALAFGLHAAPTPAANPMDDPKKTLAAIEEAKSLAVVGRGQLLFVGPALATEQSPSGNVVVILESPTIPEMQPGTILILAKVGCDPARECLIARRVTEVDAKGQVQTDPYTFDELLISEVKARLLGSVSYAIDLESGSILDMQAGHAPERVTLSQAISRERAKMHHPVRAELPT